MNLTPSNEFLKQEPSQTNGCAFDVSDWESPCDRIRVNGLLLMTRMVWVRVMYISLTAGNGETRGYVERVKPGGKPGEFEPADFTCSAPNAGEYISGNRLTGRPEWEGEPAESWGRGEAVEGVAVDSGSDGRGGCSMLGIFM